MILSTLRSASENEATIVEKIDRWGGSPTSPMKPVAWLSATGPRVVTTDSLSPRNERKEASDVKGGSETTMEAYWPLCRRRGCSPPGKSKKSSAMRTWRMEKKTNEEDGVLLSNPKLPTGSQLSISSPHFWAEHAGGKGRQEKA
ncbi:unnamed protein product [Linum trigynum]|uniref:Uncharacterized protein n=1 Tax=Linum trigynum TaxID=586398 RepID=A0AAV2E0F4_9ROSI